MGGHALSMGMDNNESDQFERLRVLRGQRAISFLDANSLLVSNGYRLSKYFIGEDRFDHLLCLSSFAKRLLSSSRYISRAIRLGIRDAIRVSDDRFLVRCDHTILDVDLETKTSAPIQLDSDYHPPLAFSRIEGISGFADQLVFGEYFRNHSRKPVSLFRQIGTEPWTRAFQFDAGQINHVHCLVPDSSRQGVWIFTGDFEHSAAIWFARDDFRNVERIASGRQCFRSCFGFPTTDGLFYCTDSPLESNGLFFLRCDDSQSDWRSEQLKPLPGPVIFSGETKSGRLFSTSVEPMPDSTSTIKPLLSRSLGPGVQSNQSTVWHLDHHGNLSLVDSRTKDSLPYLFQFGMRTFPTGGSCSDYLVFYNIAMKQHDNSTEIWRIR